MHQISFVWNVRRLLHRSHFPSKKCIARVRYQVMFPIPDNVLDIQNSCLQWFSFVLLTFSFLPLSLISPFLPAAKYLNLLTPLTSLHSSLLYYSLSLSPLLLPPHLSLLPSQTRLISSPIATPVHSNFFKATHNFLGHRCLGPPESLRLTLFTRIE